jgi:hypothetical protein
MTAPNINVTGLIVTIDTLEFEATTSAATVTNSTVATDHARKIEAIFATSKLSSGVALISVWHRKGGTDFPLTLSERVSLAQKINVLLGAPLYMAEGDSLKVQANASNAINIAAPYVDMVEP